VVELDADALKAQEHRALELRPGSLQQAKRGRPIAAIERCLDPRDQREIMLRMEAGRGPAPHRRVHVLVGLVGAIAGEPHHSGQADQEARLGEHVVALAGLFEEPRQPERQFRAIGDVHGLAFARMRHRSSWFTPESSAVA